MQGEHAYIDESTQGDYLVVCSVMPSGSVTQARKAMKGLLLPGQRSLHMKNERKKARQDQIIGTIMGLAPEVIVYCAKPSDHKGHTGARDACLRRAAVEGVDRGIAAMYLDRNETYVQRDRHSIIAGSSSTGAAQVPFKYYHLSRHEEALLWIPDALGWLYARGGASRNSVKTLITVKRL